MMIIARLPKSEAFGAAYFFSLLFNLFSLYWIAMVTPPGMFTVCLIVALYYAFVLVLFNKLYHFKPIFAAVAMPFLWTGMEYFRTLSQFAFPWSDLGYTQSYYSYILQIVSITSVHGLSFLIVTVNVLIWQLLRKEVSLPRRVSALWFSLGIIGLLAAWGWAVVPPLPTPGTFGVNLLQGSVPIEEKWAEDNQAYSLFLYDSLTQASVDSSVKLFVWPETSAPTYLSHHAEHRLQIGRTARKSGAWHLVGALGATTTEDKVYYHNSSYFFSPSGELVARNDKVKLVPFTEQVPYQEQLPFLRKEFLTKYLTFIETYGVRWWSDFYPGDSASLFDMGESRFGALICFESTFPEFSRRLILNGADFLAGITNDTWFGHSVGIHMHSRIFVTRMVENRCWGVRAANSGLTYIVDDYGRIRDELPLDAVAVLKGKIRLLDEYSVFTRYGDIVGKLSFLIMIGLAGIFIVVWMLRRLHIIKRSG